MRAYCGLSCAPLDVAKKCILVDVIHYFQEGAHNLEKRDGLPNSEFLPQHIGIIMDGNGRWAKQRGLGRTFGHKRGAEVFENTVRDCQSIGIPVLTVYAFSTENWKRPPKEVSAIMGLLRQYLSRAGAQKDKNVRIRFLGDRDNLDDDLVALMRQAEQDSINNNGICVNVCINYGGQDEIVNAVKNIALKVKEGNLLPQDIDKQLISDHLYTVGLPDPDLIIRPSGEQRLSNFMAWQSAYSEFVFMDVLWPDFTKDHLVDAIWQYALRDRRFGGI